MIFDFGQRLRDLRRAKKLTQTQVARRLDLSKTSISGYENNIKTPSIEVLIQISILYGVTTDYILGLEERKMIFTDGLTDRQQELLSLLLMEFRSKEQPGRR